LADGVSRFGGHTFVCQIGFVMTDELKNSAQLLRVPDASTRIGGPSQGLATEDLNITLLAWPKGGGVESHINTEVDVVWCFVEGSGQVTVNGQSYDVCAGQSLVIPKGAQRNVRATSARLCYLSVHKRRAGIALQNNLALQNKLS
jgi:mannose-6-phosphate isomerase-like protein (cupin superfamily)